MIRMLSLFQIKTTRSAWLFLIGSSLLFIFGLYQIGTSPSYPSYDPRNSFQITISIFWLLATGLYIAIASWALISVKGREYLREEEKKPIKGNRTIFWYLKFLFA